jgi:hypothetical protein
VGGRVQGQGSRGADHDEFFAPSVFELHAGDGKTWQKTMMNQGQKESNVTTMSQTTMSQTTMSQQCHKQQCHNNVTTMSQQCHNNVTTMSQQCPKNNNQNTQHQLTRFPFRHFDQVQGFAGTRVHHTHAGRPRG